MRIQKVDAAIELSKLVGSRQVAQAKSDLMMQLTANIVKTGMVVFETEENLMRETITLSAKVFIANEKDRGAAANMDFAALEARAAAQMNESEAQMYMQTMLQKPVSYFRQEEMRSRREEEDLKMRGMLASRASTLEKTREVASKLFSMRSAEEDRKYWARQQKRLNAGYGIDTKYNLSEEGEIIMSGNFWETGASFDQDLSKLPKVFVLIDGDIIAYRSSAAADGRFYEVDGQIFKYSKDAKAYADKKSIPANRITSGYDPEPLENALKTMDTTLENIRDYFISERKVNPVFKICLSCARNFRYDLYPEYKASRKKQRRPEHLDACKEHLINMHGGHRYDPYEADDLIAMMVEELSASEQEVVICSNDKDFTQLGRPGVSFYDFTTGKTWEVTEDEAMIYFWKQILTGDKSDDIPGIPGVGPETAIKILSEQFTDTTVLEQTKEYQMFLRVLKAYLQRDEEISKEDTLSKKVRLARKKIQLAGSLLRLLKAEDEVKLWKLPMCNEGTHIMADQIGVKI